MYTSPPMLLQHCLRWLVLAACCLLSPLARADSPITLFKSFAGNVSFTGTVKTMRTQSNTVDPCAINTSTMNMVLSGVPSGAVILNAQLYWAGSGATPDYTVSFDGVSLTAPAARSYTSPGIGNAYFAGAIDVTTQVKAKGNATYTVGGLAIDNTGAFCSTQAVLGGFQLLVVYSHSTETFRVLNVYEGLQYFRYSGVTLTLGNFKIPSPIGNVSGRIGHITWEGDTTLSGGGEILKYNSVEVTDATNPSGNQFNSSSNINGDTASYGIDFDAYTVKSPVIQAGQTSARSDYQSGQDLVLLNAEVIAAPNVPATDHGIAMTLETPLQQGLPSNYIIKVTNNGPLAEGGPFTVVDVLPASLLFVSAGGTGWSCGAVGQKVTCTYSGTVAAATTLPSLTLRVTTATAASGLVNNSATVSAPLYDYYDGNDTSTVSTQVGASAYTPTYAYTDKQCANGLPIGDPGQPCVLIDFNDKRLGNKAIPVYLTYMVQNVPTAQSASDTLVKLKFALSCYDPAQDAGVRASVTRVGGSSTSLPLCARAGTLPGQTTAYWTSLADVTFKGGLASSKDVYNFQYADVGRIEFLVSDSSGRLGSSGPYVQIPERLVLLEPTGNGAGMPAAPTDSRFLTAGTAFPLTIQAQLYNGGLAPNFGQETSPVSVILEARAAKDNTGARFDDMVAAGVSPELPLAFSGSFGPFSGGSATGTAFSYADVGILELTPLLSDGYLGSGKPQMQPINVGRFVPARFKTVLTAPMVCDPNGMSCPASVNGMAYSKQPFALQVIAQNTQGATTLNYQGAFARDVVLSAYSAPGSTTTVNPPATPSGAVLSANSIAAASFALGSASAAPVYTLPNAFVASAPYANNWVSPTMVYLRATETGTGNDGVTSLRSGAEEGGVAVVAGRLLVPNAYGASNLPLPLRLSAQYYGVTTRGAVLTYGWRANASDSATSLFPATALVYASCVQGCPSLAAGAASSITMNAGQASTVLKAGSSTAKSAAAVSVTGPSWLPTTKGRVTFGVYRSPLIFLREVY